MTRASALLLLINVAACDKVPLTAPTGSTITITSATNTVALGGSTQISAFVIEEAGTAVQNGTTVRFTTTLGRVEPVEAQTRNGMATATFFAGDTSGTAEVRAISGGAGGTAGTGTGGAGGAGGAGTTATNAVQIVVGAAGAAGIALSASPSTVPPSGGAATILAAVVDAVGNRMAGVPVTFGASAGTLSAGSAVTDANGEARVTLTTSTESTVTASVGSGEGRTATITVSVAGANNVSLSVSPENPTVGQPVTLTVTATVGTNSIPPTVTVSWGDGTQQTLGLVNGERTVAHTYTSTGSFIITATATTNGDAITSSIGVTVGGLAISVTVTVSDATPEDNEAVTFTANLTGDTSASISSYRWVIDSNTNAEDDEVTTTDNEITLSFPTTGLKRITVTVTTTDSRTATASRTITVQ